LLRHCCRFWQHVQFVLTLSKGRNFVRHCCKTGNIVAKNSYNVEATFDFVKKNRSICSIRHCCWCGQGLKRFQLRHSSPGKRTDHSGSEMLRIRTPPQGAFSLCKRHSCELAVQSTNPVR